MKRQNYRMLQNGPSNTVQVRMSNATCFFQCASKPTIIKTFGLSILRFAMLNKILSYSRTERVMIHKEAFKKMSLSPALEQLR